MNLVEMLTSVFLIFLKIIDHAVNILIPEFKTGGLFMFIFQTNKVIQ